MNITQELPAEQLVSKRGRVTNVILSGIERNAVAVMSIKGPDIPAIRVVPQSLRFVSSLEEAKLFYYSRIKTFVI